MGGGGGGVGGGGGERERERDLHDDNFLHAFFASVSTSGGLVKNIALV